jgi:hypothetical protein
MRITKNFRFGHLNLQVFADLSNVFNYKYMSQYGFVDNADYDAYMQSLHLPAEHAKELSYINVPGSDRPGDYRLNGAPFQPIVGLRFNSDLNSASNHQTRPFYYVQESGTYYQYVNSAWQEVDAATVKKVLDDKAYIDMPNQETFTFLNPRNIYYGIRIGFDF